MSAATHSCGARWHQAGNRTGHCAACHRTFSGISAFDAHQRMVNGRSVCLDPEGIVDKHGTARFKTFVDSEGAMVWRSAADRPAHWVDLVGIDPDYTDGVPVDEWLEANRGQA